MNLERICFRTNEKERQILASFNQRYKCNTITSLMHRLFEDIADYKLQDTQPSPAKIFGDLDIMDIPSLEKPESTEEQNAPALKTIVSPKSVPALDLGVFSQPNGTKRQVEEKRYDPYEEFLREVYDLEKLKQAIERTLPIRTIPSSFSFHRQVKSN